MEFKLSNDSFNIDSLSSDNYTDVEIFKDNIKILSIKNCFALGFFKKSFEENTIFFREIHELYHSQKAEINFLNLYVVFIASDNPNQVNISFKLGVISNTKIVKFFDNVELTPFQIIYNYPKNHYLLINQLDKNSKKIFSLYSFFSNKTIEIGDTTENFDQYLWNRTKFEYELWYSKIVDEKTKKINLLFYNDLSKKCQVLEYSLIRANAIIKPLSSICDDGNVLNYSATLTYDKDTLGILSYINHGLGTYFKDSNYRNVGNKWLVSKLRLENNDFEYISKEEIEFYSNNPSKDVIVYCILKLLFVYLDKDFNEFYKNVMPIDCKSKFMIEEMFMPYLKSPDYSKKFNEYYSEMIEDGKYIRYENEAKLFRLCREYFPDSIYQYHASFLKNQSYDIYIPSKNVAIEYQGQQHYEPLPFFGGQKHFEEQIERDTRKKEISKKQGILLIEWEYSIDINKENFYKIVIEQINNFLK